MSELSEDVLRGTTSHSLVPCLAVKGTNLMISRGGGGGGGRRGRDGLTGVDIKWFKCFLFNLFFLLYSTYIVQQGAQRPAVSPRKTDV